MNGTEWTELRLSLHKAIQKWVDNVSQKDGAVDVVGFWTDAIVAHMTDAAIHTLKVSADKENWLMEQGYLKE